MTEMRGIYGGIPADVLAGKATLADYGVNAIFLGSGGIDRAKVDLVHSQGARIFAEFNTLHVADRLEKFPDAAPIGPDGKVSPPPSGWQGICPSHEGYRAERMGEFARLLREYPLDGIWLDYHHSHASWEQSPPELPDTCFCPRCLKKFQAESGVKLPDLPVEKLSAMLLGELNGPWVEWRSDLFADWLREFRTIIDTTRPGALLGTFHCPWSDEDFDGARIKKLAIDLRKQAPFVDVFSPMPYHARFGHAGDTGWISRQVAWLGSYLGLKGVEGEKIRIWPIVQLADWGEPVPASEVTAALAAGARAPSTGVMVFAWGRIAESPEKVEAMKRFFLSSAEAASSR